MNIHEIVEAHYQGIPLIYHATSPDAALLILRDGEIKSDTHAIINGQMYLGVSLTRSKWFATIFNSIIFGFNHEALRRKLGRRMQPYADPSIDNQTYYDEKRDQEFAKGDHRREAEEFVIGSVPVAGFLVGIWISEHSAGIDPNHKNTMDDTKQIMHHPLFMGWTAEWPSTHDPNVWWKQPKPLPNSEPAA